MALKAAQYGTHCLGQCCRPLSWMGTVTPSRMPYHPPPPIILSTSNCASATNTPIAVRPVRPAAAGAGKLRIPPLAAVQTQKAETNTNTRIQYYANQHHIRRRSSTNCNLSRTSIITYRSLLVAPGPLNQDDSKSQPRGFGGPATRHVHRPRRDPSYQIAN